MAAKGAVAFATEAQVCAAIRELFPLPAYALLPGVADATGTMRGRTIDALVMSCWPSRGLRLYGVEIKVSRSDWLRELKDPAKAESVCRFCDCFYLAVGSDEIVKDGELPPTWGLLAPKGGKLAVKVPAPALDPTPMSRPFLAAILRAASEGYQKGLREEISKARHQGYQEGKQSVERTDESEAARTRRAYEDLRKAVDEFQTASGMHLSAFGDGARRMGEAVKFVMYGGLDRVPRAIDEAEKTAKRLLEEVKSYRATVARHAEAEPGSLPA